MADAREEEKAEKEKVMAVTVIKAAPLTEADTAEQEELADAYGAA